MNKLEVAIVAMLVMMAFVLGQYVGYKNVSNDIPKIQPEKEVSFEKIDMAYNIETNQTYWKYPNETEWHLIQ